MRKRERTSAGRRRPAAFMALHGKALALLCALALTLIPSALLGGQSAQAAPHATFYGIADSALLATTDTTTPSSTSTTSTTPAATATATATDTPTPTPTATNTPVPTPTATNSPVPPPPSPTPNPMCLGFSGNDFRVCEAAAAAQWPQQYNNWCGIATVALVANYLNPQAHTGQDWVYSALNSSESMWGSPPATTPKTWGVTTWGPYVPADIAQDFGTDPRSIAAGLTLATGQNYHVIVDTAGAYDATRHIVDDVLLSNQPVSVFVDHGQHSVIVSGVDATGDPLTNPSSITAIHVWDPGVPYAGIQQHMEETVPIGMWLSGIIPNSGGSDYFRYPYASNIYSGIPLDPDPSVGPYTYIPSKYNHLWVGHYVYVSPHAQGAAAGLGPDWELNQNGAVLAGFATSKYAALPAGYSGPSVLMPTNPPPPPPPVQVFRFVAPAPRPKPKPTPVPTATPPRARPSPTPAPTTSTEPILPDTAAVPARCASMSCALATMPPLWALYTFGGLLLVALLLSVVLFATRQRARPGFAGASAAGADAPLLPPAPDGALEPGTGDAPEESAGAPDVDPAPSAANEAGPAIVPVLDANTPSAAAESGETEA